MTASAAPVQLPVLSLSGFIRTLCLLPYSDELVCPTHILRRGRTKRSLLVVLL